MTYSELLVQLLQLDAEQLKKNVTVHDSANDEHYLADKFVYTTDAQNVVETYYPILSF